MVQVRAKFFDGKSSRAAEGMATVSQSQLLFESHDGSERISFDRRSLKAHPKMGTHLRVIDGPNGGRLELDATQALDKLLYPPSKGIVHLLEQNYQFVALSVVILGAFISWAYLWGIPKLAEKVVPLIPKEVSITVGDESVKTLEKFRYIKASQLPLPKRNEVMDNLNTMKFPETKVPLKFDFTKAGIPNAFALPNGQIYITDKLVDILPNTIHIRAVAWHEVGHIYHEHSMKILAKSAALTLVLFAVTGGGADVSTLPLMLMNQSYSRDAEREADQFAAKQMAAEGLDPSLLAEALEAIEAEYSKKMKKEDKEGFPEILSSHPLTKERAEFLRAYK